MRRQARCRSAVRRSAKEAAAEAAVAARAAAETTASGGLLSLHGSAAPTSPGGDGSAGRVRPLASATSRGSAVLFPYAAGTKISARAVDRHVVLTLPYGSAPAADPSEGGEAGPLGGPGSLPDAAPAVVVDSATGETTAAEEDDNAPICICRRSWRSDPSFALGCARCAEWFHARCLGLSVLSKTHMRHEATGRVDDVSGDWVCPRCRAEGGGGAPATPRRDGGDGTVAGAVGPAGATAGTDPADGGQPRAPEAPAVSRAKRERDGTPLDGEALSDAVPPPAKRASSANGHGDAAGAPKRTIADFFGKQAAMHR